MFMFYWMCTSTPLNKVNKGMLVGWLFVCYVHVLLDQGVTTTLVCVCWSFEDLEAAFYTVP